MHLGNIDRAARKEAVVGEDQELLREGGGQGIVRRAHDDRAKEAFRDLITGRMVWVRMIPVRSRAAWLKREDVVVLFSGCYRIKWAPIGCHGDMKAVPVDSRRHRQLVVEMDDDLVALANLEGRTRHAAVVRKRVALRLGNE